MIFPTVLKITLHGTHGIPPTVLKISPIFIMISPTVLNILHGTQDIPNMHHDFPPTVLHTRYTGVNAELR